MEPPTTSVTTTAYGITTVNRADDGGLNFRFEIELTSDKYTTLTDGLNPVFRLGLRDMYTLVARNYRQLDRLADFYVQLFGRVHRPARGIQPRDAANGVIEASINWLNATRLFIDHEQTSLTRRYGKESRELAVFDGARAAAFDGNFAYRFLYGLRNYTTHCGLPLSRVSLQKSNPDDAAKGLSQRIVFSLDRDDLLSQFDWGKHVTPGLRALPVTFELLPLIHEAMPHFDSIMETIICIDINEGVRAVSAFAPYMERIAAFDGHPCLLRFTPGFNVSPMPIPVNTLIKLSQVEADGDVLAPFRSETDSPSIGRSAMSAHYRDRVGRGTTILATWLAENGATSRFHQVANDLVQQDGAAEPTITGLTVVGANALTMTAEAMGTSPESILGLLASYAQQEDG